MAHELSPSTGRWRRWVALPVIPWWVFFMGVIGPLVFLAHWPYLWLIPSGGSRGISVFICTMSTTGALLGRSLWSRPFLEAFRG